MIGRNQWNREGQTMSQQEPFVMTISRMLGSGGAVVGQRLAADLGVRCLDREIVSEAAKTLYVAEDVLEEHEERPTSIWESFFEVSGMMNESVYTLPRYYLPQDHVVFEAEAEIIRRMTREESAVVIGRCGAHVLREHPRHLSVFVHADLDFRMGNVAKHFNVSPKDAKKMIEECDKRRSEYCRMFTGHDVTDSRLYEICLDTGKIGIDGCVELITAYAKKKFSIT